MEKEREQRCVRTKARARKTIRETRRQRRPRPIDRLSNKEFYYERLLVERMAFVLETHAVARESIRELLETFHESFMNILRVLCETFSNYILHCNETRLSWTYW